MFWETELSELRKTTGELTKFLALLTPVGESCAFMSIKGELSWSIFFDLFGNNSDDPRLDDFVSYVVPRIQEAVGDSLENKDLYDNKVLSARDVVKEWVEHLLSQTLFIANSYWGAIHMVDDEHLLFKRSAVCPATFSECFPRIHALEMLLPEEQAPRDSFFSYTPTDALSTTDNRQSEMERMRQTQIHALLEHGTAGGVGVV